MSSTRNLAFLGTGLMGGPMARRLLGAGFALTVWNRDASKAAPLSADGARIAGNASEAAKGANIVFTMLSDGNAVEDVLFNQGVAAALAAGAVVIDCSSIAPKAARDHAQRLAERGIRHIDAPVSGGVVGAAAGTLAIMAGGEGAVIAELAEVFSPLGRVTHVGPTGTGQLAKLGNQQIVAVTIGAVAEAMMLMEAGGGSREAFRNAIRGGFAESRILDLHGQRMVDHNFGTGGPSKLQLKDLNNILAVAESLSLALPLTETVRAEFAEFVAGGGGDVDHSGILQHFEDKHSRAKR
ncbi:NAD(P)-dependent oxidoreductase [Rhizobium sp. BE258]|uniref:NAD(P)-dependent oxidoreductase n=1 Tax=Rhizobium sp. BE258 TaxID=2817722 RepID=UPI0028645566|nr:NAD(P)-dependent oxidoreductase [Rhizobium sp. BE258]MDR7144001.1 2-hydroxy-3-oxopropionate reductase [Rhizobium sp. BE258]